MSVSPCRHRSTLSRPSTAVDPDISDKKDGDATNNGDGSSGDDSSADQGAHTPLKETSATSVAASASSASTTTSSVTIDPAPGSKTSKGSVENAVIAEEDSKNRNEAVVVPVFKVAVRLLKESLWIDEVRRPQFPVPPTFRPRSAARPNSKWKLP